MSNVSQQSMAKLYAENSELRDTARTLCTNLEFAGVDEEIQCVVVTGYEMSVGKSTVALALAMAAAEMGKRTLIIDNDLRNPQIALRMKVRSRFSIADMFSGRVQVEELCVPTNFRDLFVLDLGSRRVANPVEVLGSAKYKHCIEELRNMFDFIVIDTPPIGMFIDAAVAAQVSDGVLFVVNSGKTQARQVKESLAQLEKAKVRVLGAVLNNVIRTSKNYYYYYDRRGMKKRRKKSHAESEKD